MMLRHVPWSLSAVVAWQASGPLERDEIEDHRLNLWYDPNLDQSVVVSDSQPTVFDGASMIRDWTRLEASMSG